MHAYKRESLPLFGRKSVSSYAGQGICSYTLWQGERSLPLPKPKDGQWQADSAG